MAKYIPADKLIAEIERRKKQDITFRERNILVDIETCIASLRAEMIITSLQQEQSEVDLEAEIKKYCRDYYNCIYPDQIQNGKCSSVMPHIVEAARHFYELGLNARKEE